ncbi:putative transposase [Shigella boydii 3594-74]|nr:putative transposase [Shigella boydii 3594-74]
MRQSRHRRPLPEHLPREINRLEPEESCCPECGGELDYLGEVSAEQLELVSSALKVIRTERVKKPVQNVTASLKHRHHPVR